jgi:hypothetical protein
MSVPEWWDTHRAETTERYFDFKYVELCTHVRYFIFIFVWFIFNCYPYTLEFLCTKTLCLRRRRTPDLQRVFTGHETVFRFYGSIMELLLIIILINRLYLSFSASLLY